MRRARGVNASKPSLQPHQKNIRNREAHGCKTWPERGLGTSISLKPPVRFDRNSTLQDTHAQPLVLLVRTSLEQAGKATQGLKRCGSLRNNLDHASKLVPFDARDAPPPRRPKQHETELHNMLL